MTEFCGVLQNVFKSFVTEISENIISSMARGVQEPVFKESNYEINIMKEHGLEPNLTKNDVLCMARGVSKPIFRESSHENNISMGDFHKPLMANMEKQPTLPNNYENLFGKSHVFKITMVKNNEQATVHEFKFFDIFQNIKKYEFSWSHYTMTFVVQNPFWICGSHQTLTLMEWLTNNISLLKYIGPRIWLIHKTIIIWFCGYLRNMSQDTSKHVIHRNIIL